VKKATRELGSFFILAKELRHQRLEGLDKREKVAKKLQQGSKKGG